MEWIYRGFLTFVKLWKPGIEFPAEPFGSGQKLLWLGVLTVTSLVVAGLLERQRL